jgi:hypothetical protein
LSLRIAVLALAIAGSLSCVDDFRAAFGEDPPQVNAVAVATDTDNTGESATAFYGDIRFTQ